MTPKKELSVVSSLLLFLILVGTTVYHWIEGMSYLDALYFTVITITTIGYGDIAPVTAIGKIFTIFFVLLGVGVMLYTISLITRYLIRLESLRKARRKREIDLKKKKQEERKVGREAIKLFKKEEKQAVKKIKGKK